MADAHLNLRDTLMGQVLEGHIAPSAGTHSLPLGSRLTMVTDHEGLLELEAPWRQLEAASTSPRAVFQSFDWLMNWSRVYAAPLGPDPLCILTGFRDGRLVFAWPLMKTRVGPLTVLRWMSDPFSQYGDVLLAPGESVRAWMSEATGLLRQLTGIDAIRLRHVRADAAVLPYLEQAFRDARSPDQAPWLDLTAFAEEAAYEARYSSAQRKRRKKIRKSLEDDFGPLRFDILHPGAATDAAIDQAIHEKSQWLDERGRQNRVLDCPRIAEFIKALARSPSQQTQLIVSCLSAGARPVSWEIGLRQGRTHFGFITSHVTCLTDYSPARLHMDLSQRHALADGMLAFDLMVPDDAHKESWSSGKTGTRDFHLPLTAAGWAYGVGYLEHLRPRLRDAYYHLSPRLLKLLKPIIGH